MPVIMRFEIGTERSPLTVDAHNERRACIEGEQLIRDFMADDVPFSFMVFHRNRALVRRVRGYLAGAQSEVSNDQAAAKLKAGLA